MKIKPAKELLIRAHTRVTSGTSAYSRLPVKNCPNKICWFRHACGNFPFVCIIVQYIAIGLLIAWLGYLFFTS